MVACHPHRPCPTQWWRAILTALARQWWHANNGRTRHISAVQARAASYARTSQGYPVLRGEVRVPCGFKFDGHIEYDYSGFLLKRFFCETRDDHDKGFLGIEFFDKCDVFLSGIEGKKGIALIERK